ncbi:uncharacterized protein PHA67_001203 [Liasis olivaceus]
MEMEMLQQTMHLKRQPSSGPKICAQEAHGCGGGQGSPLPGDTASSPHSLQHSPSLPICGLTEFSETDSTPWERSSIELQELLAAKEKFSQVCILPLDLAHCRDNPDPALSTGAPQKQYVGVRVRMPVRELLKKLRVSRGMNSKEAKETSVRVATRKNSGTTGKRRACSKNQYKQNRQQTPAALKSVEDLDILVEILQEDLHQSHAKQETQLCEMGHHGGLPEVWPPFEEAESNLQPESSWESVRLQPPCSVSHSELLSHLGSESLYSDCRMKHQYLGSTNMFPNLCMQNNSYQWNDIASYSVERFQSLARDSQTASACLCPPGLIEPMSVEDKATVVLHNEGCLKARPGAIWRQEVSTLSFFQFQLRHEESWLRKIPLEKLFVPDKNGDRLLHKAVRQGKRALAFALAQRFAYRRKIDERDSAKQTALHIAAQKNHHMIFGDLVSLGASVNERDGAQKTPLHLCAQNGFVRILEVSGSGRRRLSAYLTRFPEGGSKARPWGLGSRPHSKIRSRLHIST